VPAGDKSKESDRQTSQEGAKNEVSWAKNLVYSTRLNSASLLAGDEIVKSQYPKDSMMPEIDMSTIELPLGRGVLVTANDYIEASQAAERAKQEHIQNHEYR
jgi:hypothetical protein